MEESALPDRQKLTHWKTSVALPTKVMVIGVARFAISYVGTINGVPLRVGFIRRTGKRALVTTLLLRNPGLYQQNHCTLSLRKARQCAVEDTLWWHGECRQYLYYEKSVSGKGNIEGLLAHEIAPMVW